jgi:hypothetical protein
MVDQHTTVNNITVLPILKRKTKRGKHQTKRHQCFACKHNEAVTKLRVASAGSGVCAAKSHFASPTKNKTETASVSTTLRNNSDAPAEEEEEEEEAARKDPRRSLRYLYNDGFAACRLLSEVHRNVLLLF